MYGKTLAMLAIAGTFASCAGETGKHLDQKVAEAGDVQSSHELYQKAQALTQKTPGLTPGQRQKLDALQRHVHDKLAAINTESLKLRSLLVQDVLAAKPDKKEIAAVKRRLRKLSSDRLNTLFDASDETNEILGRNDLIRESRGVEFLEQDFNYW